MQMMANWQIIDGSVLNIKFDDMKNNLITRLSNCPV